MDLHQPQEVKTSNRIITSVKRRKKCHDKKMMFSKVVIAYLTVLPYCLVALESNPTECIDSVTDGVDYFPDKVEPLASEFWNITYNNTYKILENEIEDETYLLYLCGTEPPADELDGRHKAVISIPVSDGVAITATTNIPFLELLGVRTEIQGYLGDPQYISSPCVNYLIENGTIVVVEDTTNETSLDGLLGSIGEDLVSFVSKYDNLTLNNTVTISEFEEKSNAGTFEWIKFYSVFFNLEAKANEVYDETMARYECVAENAARVATDTQTKPTVLWARYDNYSMGWDVAECPNYYCEYASTCSADLLNSFEGSIEGSGGANLMTTEEFVDFGKDADYWIYVGNDWNDVYEANMDALGQFKSVQDQQVYDYMGSGENAWFEQRLAEFDVVAQDFCAVVGTQDPFHTRVWFRNVFTDEVGEPGSCTDPSAPLESRATECVAVPSTPTTSAIAVVSTLVSAAILLAALLTV